MTINITTNRFFLRPLTIADVTERYLGWLSDSVTSRFIESANVTHERKALINYVVERCDREEVLFLGIFLRETEEHIGNIKYEPIDKSEKYSVMGILIGQSEWRGKGVANEVISSSAKFLEESYGIKKILLGVEKNNLAGIAAYQKCGFVTCDTDLIKIDLKISVAMKLDL